MKKETRKKIFWWVIGIIIYSIASLVFIGLILVIHVLLVVIIGKINIPLWDALGGFKNIPLFYWLIGSQLIFLSLLLTAAVSKINEFLLKKSKWYQWMWYS